MRLSLFVLPLGVSAFVLLHHGTNRFLTEETLWKQNRRSFLMTLAEYGTYEMEFYIKKRITGADYYLFNQHDRATTSVTYMSGKNLTKFKIPKGSPKQGWKLVFAPDNYFRIVSRGQCLKWDYEEYRFRLVPCRDSVTRNMSRFLIYYDPGLAYPGYYGDRPSPVQDIGVHVGTENIEGAPIDVVGVPDNVGFIPDKVIGLKSHKRAKSKKVASDVTITRARAEREKHTVVSIPTRHKKKTVVPVVSHEHRSIHSYMKSIPTRHHHRIRTNEVSEVSHSIPLSDHEYMKKTTKYVSTPVEEIHDGPESHETEYDTYHTTEEYEEHD